MMLNISMKSYENTLNGFQVFSRDETTSKGKKLQKYIDKSYGSCSLHIIWCLILFSMKFHENIFNVFKL